MIITTTYKDPDLDGYGCAVAYAELLRAQGEDAQAHVWGTPLLEVQWLIDEFKLPEANGPVDDAESDVVLLDASNIDNLCGLFTVDQVIEVIDHRRTNDRDKFRKANVQIELVGAAATLVCERFKDAKIVPSKESALYLLGGIISNTENLTNAITTDRDRAMHEWMYEISDAPDDLAKQQFAAKSQLKGNRLQDALWGDRKTMNLDGTLVAIAQLEIVNVEKLLESRRSEIEQFLLDLKKRDNSEYTMLNIKDLDFGQSFILCADEITRDLIIGLEDIDCEGMLCHSKSGILRKRLTALIHEKLKKL